MDYSVLWAEVERELDPGSHDMDHVRRVYKMASRIARSIKGVNLNILLPAAILHDIARKREDAARPAPFDHAEEGARMARAILEARGFRHIEEICHCVRSHRFRGRAMPETIEAKILSDADKLDAVGAVGVARAFMQAGKVGAPLYSNVDIEDYKRANLDENGRCIREELHAANLEYEVKLRRIGERLYTPQARSIFEQRIGFMHLFFETLKNEIEGA